VKARGFVAEAWIRNAFDTRYIPIAFAYAGVAPWASSRERPSKNLRRQRLVSRF